MMNCDPGKMENSERRGNRFFACLNALCLGLAIALVSGCSTPEASDVTRKKDTDKEASTLRLHLESNDLNGMGTSRIRFLRSTPVEMFVEKEPFFNEGDIISAKVIEVPGDGFAIAIQATTHGQLVLQMASTSHRNRRIAIWSRWTDVRWLAAPVMNRPVENGILVFTPDCSREEAERIVRGLNNVAIKLENQAKPEKAKKPKKSESVDEAASKFPDSAR